MRRQTAWLLIVLVGVSFMFFFVGRGRVPSLPDVMAQIGITVGVAPNPYNTLNEQLSQEQDQLNQQAADLAAREAALASSTAAVQTAPPTNWYVDGAIVFVALLVCLNFYLDWRRDRREEAVRQVIPEPPKE